MRYWRLRGVIFESVCIHNHIHKQKMSKIYKCYVLSIEATQTVLDGLMKGRIHGVTP